MLVELAKMAGGTAMGGGLLGFAKKVIDSSSGGSKFSKQDVKRVYFVSSLFQCDLLRSLTRYLREIGSEIIPR